MNKEIIVRSFTKPPHGKNIHADWHAGLLNRLMLRGDIEVLHVVLSAAEWSDGALSEELAGIYLNQWQIDPRAFLMELRSKPVSTRRKVYSLLVNDDFQDVDNSSNSRTYLTSLMRDPLLRQVAREMLLAIHDFEKQKANMKAKN